MTTTTKTQTVWLGLPTYVITNLPVCVDGCCVLTWDRALLRAATTGCYVRPMYQVYNYDRSKGVWQWWAEARYCDRCWLKGREPYCQWPEFHHPPPPSDEYI